MTCRAQAKPADNLAESLEPHWTECPSRYLQIAVGKVRAISRTNHGPLCPSCFSDPDQGWNTATGRCDHCGHTKGDAA